MPLLQNGESLNCHIKLDSLGASLQRLRAMLATVDGGEQKPSEAGPWPYTSGAFLASALQLMSDIADDVTSLCVRLEETAKAIQEEEDWRNASEAEAD